MVTNLTLAAFSQHPSVPSVLRRALPSRAESNLERIASGERVIDVHRGDTRGWWDLAADELIERQLSDPAFEDYVLLVRLSC